MQRFTTHQPIPEQLRGAIVALGNFDGFHQGHQAVAGTAIDWARAEGRPSIIATFDPHPMRHFKPDAEPFRLTTLDQRQGLFAAAGADAMLVIHFDGSVAGQSAADWFQALLVDQLGVAGVVTGEDFTFGKARGGNAALLAELGQARGIGARRVAPVHDALGAISSSRIRAALKAGDCDQAQWLLTRPFTVQGTVQHGDKNGRLLGFPTANLDMAAYLRPRYGVYAVRVRLTDGRAFNGAANLGLRPQFDPPKELLEPYLFDFAGDLYGQDIAVEFHQFLRDEAKFASLDALKQQMQNDCEVAQASLQSLFRR